MALLTAKQEQYYDILIEWNKKINLTAITDKDEVFVKHFEDSLVSEKYLPLNASLCDVGSGAGFPGVPLKLARDDLKITLIDSLNKRVIFLQELVKSLEIEATIIHTRAEDFAHTKYRESFDIVTARAVARLNTLAEYCVPLVKIGGLFIAYKALADDEIEESRLAIKVLGGVIEGIEKFTLSDGESRTLVLIRKLKATPKTYPRGKNKERTDPIV